MFFEFQVGIIPLTMDERMEWSYLMPKSMDPVAGTAEGVSDGRAKYAVANENILTSNSTTC